jgi:hypothetical protein
MDSDSISRFTCKSFDALPNIITPKDMDAFCSCLYKLDQVCGDNPKSYRLLMPFHCLTFGDALCWTKDFSWETFLKDAIEEGFTHIKKYLDDKSFPCLDFCYSSGERGISIKLVCDD